MSLEDFLVIKGMVFASQIGEAITKTSARLLRRAEPTSQ
jgi:hypothetical protein